MIVSIAMGADYQFYVKNIETHARAFFKVIIFSIGSVFVIEFDVRILELELDGSHISKSMNKNQNFSNFEGVPPFNFRIPKFHFNNFTSM